jgi:hypothetical protein
MTTVKYFIENVEDGTVLLDNGNWAPFIESNLNEEFDSAADAVTHIDQLQEGIYRIFTRYYRTNG